MKRLSKNILILGALAAVTACDPYDDESNPTPRVTEVVSVAGAPLDPEDPATSYEAGHSYATTQAPADATTPWELAGDSGHSALFVKTNVLLSGSTVQTSSIDCTPAAAWLQVNGAAAPPGWMTCYSPSAPTPNERSSIVIYQGANPTGGPTGSGWFTQASVPAAFNHLTGTVTSKGGKPLAINVLYMTTTELRVDPDTDVTETTYNIIWGETVAGGASYLLEESAADAEGNPTTWTPVGTDPTAGGGALSVTKTPNTTWLYRRTITGTSPDVAGPFTFVTDPITVTTLATAPATPTVTLESAPLGVTLTWTATDGTTYRVQRALPLPDDPATTGVDESLAPANFVTVETGIEPPVAPATQLTFTDTSVGAGQKWFYRVSALNAEGTPNNSAPTARVDIP
jgi:hypothetical protein